MPKPEPVQLRPLQRVRIKEARVGLPLWRVRDRRAAKLVGLQRANEDALQKRQELELAWQEQQATADRTWALLLDNDPETVIGVVDAAYEDNECAAAPIDVAGATLTVAMVMPPIDFVPELMAGTTPTRKISVKKRSKTARNELYAESLASHAIATVREAFAVAPSVDRVKLLVVTRGGPLNALAPLYAGTVERQHAEGVTWSQTNVLPFLVGRDDALINLTGRTNEVAAVDLSGEPDLADVLSRIDSDLTAQ